ncbi:von Ebner gland protein 2 [Nannospalax galili]|uniref:von Ebner gland protein 2 n=1 Tax=Nannospalax galili TaxID=1026970 RepID=UPI0004ED47CA|nr:von Ebner gland protein 2 [Nannospalax galili]
MKALLLTFGLGLIAALQAQAFPTLGEDQDVSGTWYLKATATDKKIPVRKLGSVSVTSMTIRTLEGGNLHVKITAVVLGRCQDMSFFLEKTKQPGKYTAYGDKIAVYIIKSRVDGHYIFYTAGERHGHQFRMAKLVGRDPNINQEALEDFENAVRAGGLNTENIIIPRQIDTCSPEWD